MDYQTAPFLMTLSDIQGHLPIASFYRCDFCTVAKQLTWLQLTVSVRYLSFLFFIPRVHRRLEYMLLLVVHPPAYGAQFSQLHLAPVALVSRAHVALGPLRLPPASSEFPDGARHPVASAYVDAVGARTCGRMRRSLIDPWPSRRYKDATCQILSRSAQNCGRA